MLLYGMKRLPPFPSRRSLARNRRILKNSLFDLSLLWNLAMWKWTMRYKQCSISLRCRLQLFLRQDRTHNAISLHRSKNWRYRYQLHACTYTHFMSRTCKYSQALQRTSTIGPRLWSDLLIMSRRQRPLAISRNMQLGRAHNPIGMAIRLQGIGKWKTLSAGKYETLFAFFSYRENKWRL